MPAALPSPTVAPAWWAGPAVAFLLGVWLVQARPTPVEWSVASGAASAVRLGHGVGAARVDVQRTSPSARYGAEGGVSATQVVPAATAAAATASPGSAATVLATGSAFLTGTLFAAAISWLRSPGRPPLALYATSGEEKKPTAAPVDDEEEPIWIRREREKATAPTELPYGVYLLSCIIVAIAAVGSSYELANGNPIFGVITKDSPLWAPILWWLILSGFPLSGWLFVKAVNVANAAAEEQDRLDGYR